MLGYIQSAISFLPLVNGSHSCIGLRGNSKPYKFVNYEGYKNNKGIFTQIRDSKGIEIISKENFES